MSAIPLILASKSPQRSYLLEGLGVPFTVVPSHVIEEECAESQPAVRAEVLAALKAEEVAGRFPEAWVLGCDTLVEGPDGSLLEKPADADEARKMLALMSGRTSLVHSGLCLRRGERQATGLSTSRVTFRDLTPESIEWWVSTELWRDRSGAFQIDGPGQLMISGVHGDWTGVVGLPVFLLGELSERLGLNLLQRVGTSFPDQAGGSR